MKKIPVNTVKAFLKEHTPGEDASIRCPAGDGGSEICLHTSLSVVEKSAFIRRMLDACFDADGDFCPEYVPPVFQATMLQMCTNLPALTLPKERTADGAPLLDIDGMSRLYSALEKESPEFVRAISVVEDEMLNLCNMAIQWKKERILAKDSSPDVSAFSSFGAACDAVLELADELSSAVRQMDLPNLMEYAMHGATGE